MDFYDDDPRSNENANMLKVVEEITPELEEYAVDLELILELVEWQQRLQQEKLLITGHRYGFSKWRKTKYTFRYN